MLGAQDGGGSVHVLDVRVIFLPIPLFSWLNVGPGTILPFLSRMSAARFSARLSSAAEPLRLLLGIP